MSEVSASSLTTSWPVNARPGGLGSPRVGPQNNATERSGPTLPILFGKPDVSPSARSFDQKVGDEYVRMNRHPGGAPRGLFLGAGDGSRRMPWRTCKGRLWPGRGAANAGSYRSCHRELAMDKAVDQLRAAYDAVPYESHAFPQTAPGQLAAIAIFSGWTKSDVSDAVCGNRLFAAGGNVLPFAIWHPRARVVGIDLSQVQVDQGRRRVQGARS